MGYTEAALVLILSSSNTGEILDKKVVRTFVYDRHCIEFYYHPKYEKSMQQHGINYWIDNRHFAQPGYTISFRCKSVGPYYTA